MYFQNFENKLFWKVYYKITLDINLCLSKRYTSYPDGAIVVYYLNIADTPSNLSLGQFEIPACGNQSQVDLFIFTASTGDMKDRYPLFLSLCKCVFLFIYSLFFSPT